MEKIKLLIVDMDAAFAELVKSFMKNFPDIELIGCEQNGQDGLRVIRSAHPDAVLFDLVLPGIDGISLLRSVNEMRRPPVMICCTRFYSDVAMEAMRTFGAAYLLYKPIELQALHPAIVSCTQLHRRMRASLPRIPDEDDSGKSHAHIRNYIVSLGIPSKLIGCSYLTEAVRLGRMDVTLTRNLSKGLYLEIARSMNTTPVMVNRDTRWVTTTAPLAICPSPPSLSVTM